jgi:hypothetical protein
MLRPSALRIIDRFFLYALLMGGAVVPAAGQRCDSSAGPRIVSGIYDQIKADRNLASQMSHINVVAAYFDPNDNTYSVKFQGWADSKYDYDQVRGFGMAASCVRSVNVNLFLEEPPGPDSLFRSSSGCASGTKPCGDVCIPVGDSCGLSAIESAFYPKLRLEDLLVSRLILARSNGL